MREDQRRNANPNILKRIKKMKMKDLELLPDYISRIQPVKEKLPAPDWKNPDFK